MLISRQAPLSVEQIQIVFLDICVTVLTGAVIRRHPTQQPHGGEASCLYVTAVGANAPISVTTSTMTGRSAVSAREIAGAMSDGCSTRMPIAPMSSVRCAKLTLR